MPRNSSLSIFLVISTIYVSFCSSQLAKCANNGIPLNSTTCRCPGFTKGDLCEDVGCSRFGILDKNRCACAPGMYDKYCGHRGCRPLNEDALDFSKRTMIIVFNTKTSMKDQLNSLKDNFNNIYKSILTNQTSKETQASLIENFIIYGFVKNGNDTKDVLKVVSNAEDVISTLDGLELSDGDVEQPVISAVVKAQQSVPEMKARSIVLVFTDSPASDATSWSQYFPENLPEQKLVYISVLWGNSISFLLSVPPTSDFTKDSMDVYRRIAFSTNGDMFLVNNTTESIEVLENVIGMYHYPENIAVGYEVSGNISIVPSPDNVNDIIFALITVDQPNENIPDIPGTTLLSIGSNHKLFSFSKLYITISSDSTTSLYNYRLFIQSQKTVLLDFNSDELIDVGNGILRIGDAGFSTTRAIGFDLVDMRWSVYSRDNSAVIHEGGSVSERKELDCTYPYSYEPWVDNYNCPPGPTKNIVKLYHDKSLTKRVTPGYCIIVEKSEVGSKTIEQSNNNEKSVCDPSNIDAINDPRLKPPKQFIFILEQHSGNKNVYKELAANIQDIINNMDSSEDSYDHEFTLMIHCDKQSRVLISTYNPKIFVNKFGSFVDSIQLFDNLDNTMGLLSVIHAQKSIMQPTAQVYYFTNQGVENVQNISRKWDIIDRNIEFNFFSIQSSKDYPKLPRQLDLVRTMSNGRLIGITNSTSQIKDIILNMIQVNGLTTDLENDDCSNGQNFTVYVENDGESIFEVVGNDIEIREIFDANNNPVSNNSFTRVILTSNLYMGQLNKNENYTKGKWRMNVKTSSGKCHVSIRVSSGAAVLLGFTSSITNDAVLSQIPTQRLADKSDYNIYVAAHINTDSLTTKELVIESEGQNSSFNFTNRDSSCTYSYITNQLMMPSGALTKWIFQGYDASNNIVMRRIFYYYQHYPADKSVCNGNQVNQFGECICPDGYTGEYCKDPICVNGGTRNFGICCCPAPRMGLFCEAGANYGNSSTSTTPLSNHSSTSVTPTSNQSSTSSATPTSNQSSTSSATPTSNQSSTSSATPTSNQSSTSSATPTTLITSTTFITSTTSKACTTTQYAFQATLLTGLIMTVRKLYI